MIFKFFFASLEKILHYKCIFKPFAINQNYIKKFQFINSTPPFHGKFLWFSKTFPNAMRDAETVTYYQNRSQHKKHLNIASNWSKRRELKIEQNPQQFIEFNPVSLLTILFLCQKQRERVIWFVIWWNGKYKVYVESKVGYVLSQDTDCC